VGQLKLKKPKTLEELTPPDRKLCQVLVSLRVVFNTAQLIKHEFNSSNLKGYIDTCFDSFSTLMCMPVITFLCLRILWLHYDFCRIIFHVFLDAGMVLNEEKRKRLAEMIAHCQGAVDGASGSNPSAPLLAVPLAAAPALPTPAPIEKDKGVVAIESDDEDIGMASFLKGKGWPSHSATNGCHASFRDHPPTPPPPA